MVRLDGDCDQLHHSQSDIDDDCDHFFIYCEHGYDHWPPWQFSLDDSKSLEYCPIRDHRFKLKLDGSTSIADRAGQARGLKNGRRRSRD